MERASIWNPNYLELDPGSTTYLTSLCLNSTPVNNDRLLFRLLHYLVSCYIKSTWSTAWSIVSATVCLLFLFGFCCRRKRPTLKMA